MQNPFENVYLGCKTPKISGSGGRGPARDIKIHNNIQKRAAGAKKIGVFGFL